MEYARKLPNFLRSKLYELVWHFDLKQSLCVYVYASAYVCIKPSTKKKTD